MIRATWWLAAAFALSLAPVSAKTLVFCSEGSPEALNPQLVTSTTGMNAARPIFNNLVEFVPGTTRLAPGLADSWTVSDDGLVYTFHLRRGVKFHSNRLFTPSREMNSEDVAFSLMRQWRTDHPYHQISGSGFDFFKDMGMADLLGAVETPDPRTVRITLTRPEAPFLANLAMAFSVVHSAEYAEHLLRSGTPSEFDRQPIGTGPFAFVSYQKDVTIRYRAFPDYWGGPQPIENLIYSITPNPSVRLAKLKAGECQLMAFPNPGDLKEITRNPELTLMRQEGLNVGYLALNVTRKPFDDVRVRRALNMAIDKAAILSNVYQGAGVAAKNPLPPTLWSYDDSTPPYPHDPVQAQRLLTEAGYAHGFETELWYMPVDRPYMPSAKRIAEMIQADLAKIGIRLRLVTHDWASYRAKLQAGEHTMALYGWTGDNGDPDNFLHLLLGCAAARTGGNNIAKWCNADYDRLVTDAKLTPDQPTREQLYRKAQAIFAQEAPWVPLAHSVVFMAARKEVSGFRMDPLGRHPFEGVDLKN